MTEIHAKQQWVELPFSLFWVQIEEFVENNHQIGRKYEEQVKRIKNDEQRALAKAKQIWVSLHSEVQEHIHKILQQGKRGPHKKKTSIHPVVTPKQIRKRSAEFSNDVSPFLRTNSDGDDSPPTRASMTSDSR